MAASRRSGGRSRLTLALLVFTSLAILTLNFRDAGIVKSARGAAGTVFSPLKGVGETVSRPFTTAWHGVWDYGDLEDENARLRERIAELYRNAVADSIGASSVSRSHALVVTDAGNAADLTDPVSVARRLALLGEAARTVFAGSETIGQIGTSKVVVVAPRNERLADRVSLLRRMVVPEASRVWIEGLPGSDASAVSLLDELARA